MPDQNTTGGNDGRTEQTEYRVLSNYSEAPEFLGFEYLQWLKGILGVVVVSWLAAEFLGGWLAGLALLVALAVSAIMFKAAPAGESPTKWVWLRIRWRFQQTVIRHEPDNPLAGVSARNRPGDDPNRTTTAVFWGEGR